MRYAICAKPIASGFIADDLHSWHVCENHILSQSQALNGLQKRIGCGFGFSRLNDTLKSPVTRNEFKFAADNGLAAGVWVFLHIKAQNF